MFPVSSTSPDELRRTAGRLASWLQSHGSGVALPDLAYTLARRRVHRPVRTTVMGSSIGELTEALQEVADGDTPYQAAVGRDDRGPVWVGTIPNCVRSAAAISRVGVGTPMTP